MNLEFEAVYYLYKQMYFTCSVHTFSGREISLFLSGDYEILCRVGLSGASG